MDLLRSINHVYYCRTDHTRHHLPWRCSAVLRSVSGSPLSSINVELRSLGYRNIWGTLSHLVRTAHAVLARGIANCAFRSRGPYVCPRFASTIIHCQRHVRIYCVQRGLSVRTVSIWLQEHGGSVARHCRIGELLGIA